MANITEFKDKNGISSYRVTCFLGRNADKKQIKKNKTFRPDPAMSKREVKKAVAKFAAEFE